MLTVDAGCEGRCRDYVRSDIVIPPNRPKFFVLADAAAFPFRFFCFEHMKKPELAMKELLRVGKRSFFVTDHFLSIFCYLGGKHKYVWLQGTWHSLALYSL